MVEEKGKVRYEIMLLLLYNFWLHMQGKKISALFFSLFLFATNGEWGDEDV